MADRNGYDVGDVVVVTVTVRDPAADDALVDASVTVRALAPGASSPVSYDGVRVSLGVYQVEVAATAPGTWQLAASTAGTFQAAAPGAFHVRTPNIA